MQCSCRAAPLRTFIHGLAQVHRIESSSRPGSWISASQARSYNQRLVAPTRHSNRPFLQTRYYSENAVASEPAAIKPEKSEKATETKSSTGPSTNNGKILGSTDNEFAERVVSGQRGGVKGRDGSNSTAPNTKRSKKPRWRDTAPESHTEQTSPRNKKKSFTNKDTNHTQETKSNDLTKSGEEAQENTKRPQQETWRVQKERLKEKFPEGWKPRKRLSPDALAGIRALNAQFPEVYTTQNLANKFEVSAEHIRRILKSKWQPDVDEEQERQERWHRRGMQIWETKAALGVKPPRKWRAEGIARDPAYHSRRKARIQRDKNWEEEENQRYKAYRANLKKAAGKVV